MVIVGENESTGSKGFAEQVWLAVRPYIVGQLDDEDVADFDNEVWFFGFLALFDLGARDFNLIANLIIQADLDEQPKRHLVEMLKADPRFKH